MTAASPEIGGFGAESLGEPAHSDHPESHRLGVEAGEGAFIRLSMRSHGFAGAPARTLGD